MKLELRNISKKYGKTEALHEYSAVFENGIYGLLGPNGAGKTTLMNIVATLMKPSGGEVLFDGKSIYKMGKEYRRILGYLPQYPGLYPFYTGRELLSYFAKLKDVDASAERINELLGLVHLLDAADKKVGGYSGGMKKRMAIAVALLNNPKLIVMDEPTAGLDPKERVRFRNLISDYAAGRIVILSTHIVSDIEAIADEVLLMRKGKLVSQGTVAELTKKAEGKVWELAVSPTEAKVWQEKAAVANLRHEGEQVMLRILSDDRPAEEAVPCEATLEDLYLQSFRE